ncbi:MAG: haloacid dehalogenase-like hydrolase, partial [Anaerolineales bacterium]
ARLLRIPNLICTEIETVNHVPTGALRGVPAFREGKVTRLRAWLEARRQTLEGAWAYSDSHNDLPLLQLAAHPVAVMPDDTLRAHALSAGWQVM